MHRIDEIGLRFVGTRTGAAMRSGQRCRPPEDSTVKYNAFPVEHKTGSVEAVSGCVGMISGCVEHNSVYVEHNMGCVEMISGYVEVISGCVGCNWGLEKCKNPVLAWIGTSFGGSGISVREGRKRIGDSGIVK